jgi:hypothetical protein
MMMANHEDSKVLVMTRHQALLPHLNLATTVWGRTLAPKFTDEEIKTQ